MAPSRLHLLSVVHFQSTLFQTKGQNLIVPMVSFFSLLPSSLTQGALAPYLFPPEQYLCSPFPARARALGCVWVCGCVGVRVGVCVCARAPACSNVSLGEGAWVFWVL